MKTVFTIVRHGETSANSDGIIQGHRDVPLNAVGEDQARRLGRRWRGKTFDAVYSSDLSRAMRTAELAVPGQTPTAMPELREMDLGKWCGMSVTDIARRFPEQWAAFRYGSMDCIPPEGESRREVARRIERFLVDAAARHPGGNVLVVTHGGVLRVFFRLVLGGDQARIALLPATSNTGVSVARFDLERREWRLITWNDTSHLEVAGDGEDAY